jgi:hypothetical protein
VPGELGPLQELAARDHRLESGAIDESVVDSVDLCGSRWARGRRHGEDQIRTQRPQSRHDARLADARRPGEHEQSPATGAGSFEQTHECGDLVLPQTSQASRLRHMALREDAGGTRGSDPGTGFHQVACAHARDCGIVVTHGDDVAHRAALGEVPLDVGPAPARFESKLPSARAGVLVEIGPVSHSRGPRRSPQQPPPRRPPP